MNEPTSSTAIPLHTDALSSSNFLPASGSSSGIPVSYTAMSASEQKEEKIAATPLTDLSPPNTRSFPLLVGSDSVKGKRATMEDKATILQHPLFSAQTKLPDNGRTRSLFAVYDGHGGEVCAEYCRRYLHGNMVIQDSFKSGKIDIALKDAVLATEKNFLDAAKKANLDNTSGTCAIIAYIEGDVLIVANVGDSRAVLCRKGKAVALSRDHKPSRPDERKRVEERGGAVARADYEARNPPSACCDYLSASCCCPCLNVGPLRVYPGGLAVSRSLGDVGLKGNGLIIADPEIVKHILTSEDEFLILACDGIWDVMSNQQAVNIVRQCIKAGKDATQASVSLTQTALSRGSLDNCTVVVVIFSDDPIYARSSSSQLNRQQSPNRV
jgi:serine/threonine protein phosphatase PrpC